MIRGHGSGELGFVAYYTMSFCENLYYCVDYFYLAVLVRAFFVIVFLPKRLAVTKWIN